MTAKLFVMIACCHWLSSASISLWISPFSRRGRAHAAWHTASKRNTASAGDTVLVARRGAEERRIFVPDSSPCRNGASKENSRAASLRSECIVFATGLPHVGSPRSRKAAMRKPFSLSDAENGQRIVSRSGERAEVFHLAVEHQLIQPSHREFLEVC